MENVIDLTNIPYVVMHNNSNGKILTKYGQNLLHTHVQTFYKHQWFVLVKGHPLLDN